MTFIDFFMMSILDFFPFTCTLDNGHWMDMARWRGATSDQPKLSSTKRGFNFQFTIFFWGGGYSMILQQVFFTYSN